MATDLTPAPASQGDVLAELLTAQQVAEILQLRTSTVEDYARRGLLPSLKVGRHRRFLRSAVGEAIVGLSRYA